MSSLGLPSRKKAIIIIIINIINKTFGTPHKTRKDKRYC